MSECREAAAKREATQSSVSLLFCLLFQSVGRQRRGTKDAKTNECETKIYRIDLKDVVVVVVQ